jgi:glycosyltransferase involved in cell wall biosynthesis
VSGTGESLWSSRATAAVRESNPVSGRARDGPQRCASLTLIVGNPGTHQSGWKGAGSRTVKTDASCRLSAVVPCYNESEGLDALHRRLSAACRAVAGDDYEIVLVNDGSKDETWTAMRRLALADRHVVAMSLTRNFGHQLALSAGLSLCRGERILIVDADLQDPPELLAEMYRLMDGGADVVYGERTDRLGETRLKRWTARLFYRILSALSDVEIPMDTGDFRLMSRRVLDALNAMPEQHRFIRGMVAWAGFRQVPIPYAREARLSGTTHYPLRKMLHFALDGITSFSIRPLRLSFYASIALLVVAILLLVYVGYSWLFLDTVRGWPSLLAFFLFFSSAQLLILGIVGEYVGRIFMESKSRPLFLISEIVSERTNVPAGTPEYVGAFSEQGRVR